jgi:hypothetical protein
LGSFGRQLSKTKSIIHNKSAKKDISTIRVVELSMRVSGKEALEMAMES